ncbi:MAG TPA: hypothetical protein VGS62_05715 [Streptosporangiaceae bacterium]|nr:hypothetical protein [Streptosporangiaceae bacterium]
MTSVVPGRGAVTLREARPAGAVGIADRAAKEQSMAPQQGGNRDAELERLRQRYPRWRIWRGHTTGDYWAMPPRGHPVARDLISASDADDLARRLAEAEKRRLPVIPALPVRTPRRYVPRHGAGWQAHIEDLAAHLAGRPAADWRTRWAELAPAYQDQQRRLR